MDSLTIIMSIIIVLLFSMIVMIVILPNYLNLGLSSILSGPAGGSAGTDQPALSASPPSPDAHSHSAGTEQVPMLTFGELASKEGQSSNVQTFEDVISAIEWARRYELSDLIMVEDYCGGCRMQMGMWTTDPLPESLHVGVILASKVKTEERSLLKVPAGGFHIPFHIAMRRGTPIASEAGVKTTKTLVDWLKRVTETGSSAGAPAGSTQ